jgi:hypothetical protein
MANASLISRMQRILDEYESGLITPTEVERAIEFHMQGMDRIDLATVRASRRLSYRLVTAHLSDGETDFKDAEVVSSVLRDFGRFIQSLPTEGDSI